MPALQSEVVTFLDRVKDGLKSTPQGTRASLTTTKSGSDLVIRAREAGTAGNSYTVAFTLPGGTSALAVTAVGTVVTVALGVTVGVATAGANTLGKIAAAVNAAISGLHAHVDGVATPEIVAAVAVASLAGGAAASSTFQAAPAGAGYLRAQDLASAFELLQDATASATLTATGGSATTAAVTSVVSGAYTGATILFDAATTTVALRGVSATVLSNNGTTFTLTEALPAAAVVAAGDTFTVTSTLFDGAISKLRGTAGSAGSPAGNPLGLYADFIDACQFALEQLASLSITPKVATQASLAVAATPASTAGVVYLTDAMRPGQFDGYLILVGGTPGQVDFTTEDAVYLKKDLSTGAPAAAAAVSIMSSDIPKDRPSHLGALTHVGGHPAAARVAEILGTVQGVVEAFVLPA